MGELYGGREAEIGGAFQKEQESALFRNMPEKSLKIAILPARPPSCARVSIIYVTDLNIFKFYICNVTRILPSGKYLIKKSSIKNALFPVKRPFTFASFD